MRFADWNDCKKNRRAAARQGMCESSCLLLGWIGGPEIENASGRMRAVEEKQVRGLVVFLKRVIFLRLMYTRASSR